MFSVFFAEGVEAPYFEIYTPDYTDILGLYLESTLAAGSVTVADSLYMNDYIRLYSANDLSINADITSDVVELVADSDMDGIGDLYSYTYYYPVTIAAQNSHVLQSAGDFVIIGDHISCGAENEFEAYLMAPDEGDLGNLEVVSTAGDVVVARIEGDRLERRGYSGIYLESAGDIILQAPVFVELGPLSMLAYGSIVSELTDESAIISDNSVYLWAEGVIGTIGAPIDVLISSGILSVAVYGQIDGISAEMTGETPSGNVTIGNSVYNLPPGEVRFNTGTVEPPVVPVTPEPEPEPEPEPVVPSSGPSEITEAPLTNIISYSSNPTDAAGLENFRISSPIGNVFLYHPIVSADFRAVETAALGAGAYQLIGGQLQLIGNEGLLQFFREFDQKRKQM